MNRGAAEVYCLEQGLDTEYIVDAPGTRHEPHAHHGVIGFTLKGSAELTVDESAPATLQPGTQFIIGEGQVHETVAGDDGWEYVIGWSPEDAARYASETP